MFLLEIELFNKIFVPYAFLLSYTKILYRLKYGTVTHTVYQNENTPLLNIFVVLRQNIFCVKMVHA